MSAPGAKLGDRIVAIDTHIVMIPSPGGPMPTPVPSPFDGRLVQSLSASVCIENKPLALRGSVALNDPPHLPAGGPFQTPPTNRGTIDQGSTTVYVDNKPVARAGDTATTCNEPSDAPQGVVVADGTVFFGG